MKMSQNIEQLRLSTDFKYFSKWSWLDPIYQTELILTKEHIQLITLLMKWLDTIVVAYRWFGKSTVVTYKYAMWRAMMHSKTIIIFSATEDLAIDKLKKLKSWFETIDNLNNYCGRGIHTWKDNEIWLTDKSKKRITSDGKEIYPIISVIKAVGFDSKMRWLHADIIVADDIVVEENTLSNDGSPDPDKIEAVKRNFNQKVVPLRNPWWAIINVGTPQYWDQQKPGESDLLFDWMYNKKHIQKFLLPALNEYDEPTCPELHDKQFLALQRDTVWDEDWDKEYMLNPKTKSKINIDDEVLSRCLKETESYVDEYIPKADEIVILGTDFSVIDNKLEAEKKRSAYFALVPLLYNIKTGKRKPLNLYYERWIWFTDQLNKVVHYLQLYWCRVLALEISGWMRYFQSELAKLIPAHVGIVDTTNYAGKFDTFKWLPSMEYLFTKAIIDLPNRTEEDKEKNKFFLHEVKYMQTANHVDVLDAMLRADTVIRDQYVTIWHDENFSVRKNEASNNTRYNVSDLDKDILTTFGPPTDRQLKDYARERSEEIDMYQSLHWDINVKIQRLQ